MDKRKEMNLCELAVEISATEHRINCNRKEKNELSNSLTSLNELYNNKLKQ